MLKWFQDSSILRTTIIINKTPKMVLVRSFFHDQETNGILKYYALPLNVCFTSSDAKLDILKIPFASPALKKELKVE